MSDSGLTPCKIKAIISRDRELHNNGITGDEAIRVLQAEFSQIPMKVQDWPPLLTNSLDIVDRIDLNYVPATKFPPDHLDIDPPNIPRLDMTNYIATGNKLDSQPEMQKEGWAGSRSTPEFQYQPEQYTAKMARYIYTGHDDDDICQRFANRIYDLADYQRPVPPSEGRGYTNTHPNCQCKWEPVEEDTKPSMLRKKEKEHIQGVHRIIGQKARHGTLHKVHKDGRVYKTTTEINPRKIQETISGLRNEFQWMTPDYLNKIKALEGKLGGRFLLIRAAGESVTDHRFSYPPEPYRRLLSSDELFAMARTAIGKGLDINHFGLEFKTEGKVIDSEFDKRLKQIQMLVHESDPEILNAIDQGIITAVSINGSPARQTDIECKDECFVVPKGIVLGEHDGIALTYVVTNPRGFEWRGKHIPPDVPGIKITKIESL